MAVQPPEGFGMSLESQIADRAKEIHTDGYPMSIGEMISLYRDGDIDIHPEFQRMVVSTGGSN